MWLHAVQLLIELVELVDIVEQIWKNKPAGHCVGLVRNPGFYWEGTHA